MSEQENTFTDTTRTILIAVAIATCGGLIGYSFWGSIGGYVGGIGLPVGYCLLSLFVQRCIIPRK
jgi:hypothetical protein